MRTRGALGRSKGAAAPEERTSNHGEGSGDTVEAATRKKTDSNSRRAIGDGENGDQRRLECILHVFRTDSVAKGRRALLCDV